MNNTLYQFILFFLINIPSLLWAYECSYATEVECGGSYWYDAPTSNHFESSDYDVSDCGSSSWAYSGNDQLFHLDLGVYPQDVSIKLTGLSADLDLLLFRSCNSGGGNASLSNCAGVSLNAGNSDEEILLTDASGEYYIMVDAYSASVSSGFDLSIDCVAKSVVATCASAKELSCGNSYWIDASNTNSFNKSNYDFSSCGHSTFDYDGNDHLFLLDLGSSYKNVSIIVNGMTADLDVMVFEACNGNEFGSCVAFGVNGGNSPENIELKNASGRYYVIVDGFITGSSSGYDIRVNCEDVHSSNAECSKATELSCGDNYWINPSTSNHFSDSEYDFSSCFQNAYDYEGRDHLYKIDVGSVRRDVKITVTELWADLDMFLFRACDDRSGGDILNSCLAYSINSGNRSEQIVLNGATGTYYLSIDGFSPGISSGYEISVDCEVYQAPYGCSEAINLTCGASYWIEPSSSNELDAWDYDLSDCTNSAYNYLGRDHLYALHVGNDEVDLTIDLTGLTADLDMFLFESCYNRTTGARLANCVDFSRTSGNGAEQIFIPDAKGTYYLSVDAMSTMSSSGYEIEVHCVNRNVPNRNCDAAVPIGCGDTVIGSNSLRDPTSSDVMNTHFGCNTNGSGYGSREVVYKLDGGYYDLNNVSIKMKPLSSGVNFDLFIYRGCSSSYNSTIDDWEYGMDIMLACGQSIGAHEEEIYLGNIDPFDDIYIVVDVKSVSNKSGLFELSVVCENFCNYSADVLTCGDEISATTAGGRDAIQDYACDNRNNSGPENIYKLVINDHIDLKIDLLVSDEADLNMYLLPSCEFTACLSLSNNEGAGENEQIIRSVSPGTYYLVIDGTNQDSGAYNLFLCHDGDPEESESPTEEPMDPMEEEPDNTASCLSIVKNYIDQSFAIELQIDIACSDEVLTLQEIDETTDTLIEGSIQSLTLDSSGKTIFLPALDELPHAYVICFEQCEADSTMTCCERVTTDPILTCGSSYSGSTIGRESNFHKDDISACYVSASNFGGPDQLIQVVKEDSSDVLQLILEQVSANLSLFIFDDELEPLDLSCKGSNFNDSKMIANPMSIGEVYTDIDNLLPAGTYYVLVEGYAPWVASDFTLTVSCGLSCDGPLMIACGTSLLDQTVMDSISRQSLYRLNADSLAVGYLGAEELYQLNVTSAQTLTITLDNFSDSADYDLFVLGHDCGTGVVRNYSIQSGSAAEVITSHFTPGYYRVIVDGWLHSSGSYNINVTGCEDVSTETLSMASTRSTIQKAEEINITNVVVSPNPFTDLMMIKVNSAIDQNSDISFYDLSGRLIYSKEVLLDQGENKITLRSEELDGYSGIIVYSIKTDTSLHSGRVIRVQ